MNKHVLSIAIIFSILSSSCTSLYMPNVPNTPMLSQQGELHASGNLSLRGNASLNTAYAVSSNFGVILNGAFINRDQNKKDYRQNMLEIGGGYFSTFGPDDNRILEIYAGLGRGKSERIYSDFASNGALISSERQEMMFSKGFLQVNYSSRKERGVRLFGKRIPLNYGTAIRGSYLNMKDFKINNIDQPKEDNIFIEPIFFTRMRLSDAFQLQYTTGSNFGLKNRKYLTAGNSVFSLGFVVNVGGMNLSK
ncbi:hypothetical protein WG906_02305 [Pedobacter sp. P351]|uniref:hypothetical protein n=1 Tax=Pedobacter superstes TaxID=3133441 RepID=UPI00309D3904